MGAANTVPLWKSQHAEGTFAFLSYPATHGTGTVSGLYDPKEVLRNKEQIRNYVTSLLCCCLYTWSKLWWVLCNSSGLLSFFGTTVHWLEFPVGSFEPWKHVPEAYLLIQGISLLSWFLFCFVYVGFFVGWLVLGCFWFCLFGVFVGFFLFVCLFV